MQLFLVSVHYTDFESLHHSRCSLWALCSARRIPTRIAIFASSSVSTSKWPSNTITTRFAISSSFDRRAKLSSSSRMSNQMISLLVVKALVCSLRWVGSIRNRPVQYWAFRSSIRSSARTVAPLTHSFAPHCSLRSFGRSFVRSLAHSLTPELLG